MRAIIWCSDIWKVRKADPYNPVLLYGLSLHGNMEEFMCHVYTWEDYIATNCLSYEEQMGFVINLLNALNLEKNCVPVRFEATVDRYNRFFCVSHSLGLAILDRLLGLDQGMYYMYWHGHVHQGDVGPTPLHPNCTYNGACRHPFVNVNCDRRFRFRADMLSKFQARCYPSLIQLRRLQGLPPFVEGYIEAAACGLIYPLIASNGCPPVWYFNFPPDMKPHPFWCCEYNHRLVRNEPGPPEWGKPMRVQPIGCTPSLHSVSPVVSWNPDFTSPEYQVAMQCFLDQNGFAPGFFPESTHEATKPSGLCIR